MRIFLLSFVMITTVRIQGQADLREAADDLRNFGMDELIKWTATNIHDQEGICRFFYYWTAANIMYDINAAAVNGDEPMTGSEIAENILSNRRAVCSGYAILYREFLTRAGIQCVIVDGMSKSPENVLLDTPYKEDHSWSAFCLEGEWFLADVTWASTTAWEHYIDDFYFKTSPEIFILDHFPTDPSWQLTSEPVTIEQFKDFPLYTKKYFQLGFGGYIQPSTHKRIYESYFMTIGLSERWKPLPVLVDQRDNETEVAYEISVNPQRNNQVIKVVTDKGIIRLDAYYSDRISVRTELGLAYFKVGH